MGILPLQYASGDSAKSLGITGSETFDILDLGTIVARAKGGQTVKVTAKRADGSHKTFDAVVRVDTPNEFAYYQNGGILHYVVRSLLQR
jgi:aconitate hydratase